MKILSPVSNLESLKAAIACGADEVYLGINAFNARNNIDGFTLETLKDAVDYAHVFNVKVLLAINILFSNEELQDALNTCISACNMGVDALIIQDLGLAYVLHRHYPEIELHASTQMGIHNLEGVKAILPFGFKRVVLARETPLDEIKRIKQNVNIEIEYFCQGALCVSFSGNCYLSSYLNNASGNRGKCKQLCRLPYKLYNNNKLLKTGYLLSAKDFNMIDHLPALKNAGVDVLKIEGRARRTFYVAAATQAYYSALNGKPFDKTMLELAFNRTYTPGYFNGNHNIISNLQNHIGIFIGNVTSFKKGKKFNEVFFTSNKKLYPKSVFKFFDNGNETNTITAYDLTLVSKNTYKLTTTQTVPNNCTVNLIVDSNAEDNIDSINKKAINVSICAEINKPIKATIKCNNNTVTVLGETCQSANNQPLTHQDFINSFSKSDLFSCNLTFNKFDNIFLTKKQLNEFRRTAFDAIYKKITSKHYKKLKFIDVVIDSFVNKFTNFEIIYNLNQNFSAQNIIYSPEEYTLDNVLKFIDICKQQNKTPILDTPNFALKNDITLIKEIIDKTQIAIVANNYYALLFNTDIIIGAGLNVYNNVCANIYNKPIITAESHVSTQINFPYMTLRHCPFKNHLNASCTNCPYNNNYYYQMENGKKLKLFRKKMSSCTFYLTN